VIFNHPVMLLGLIAILVPILIHLLNRSRAKILDWGAMRFLLASLTAHNRRILIEEIILLTLRCLLVALVVLAMARPFLPSRSQVPWAIVLPAALGAAMCLSVATAMWSYRRARWALLAAAMVLAGSAAAASAIERYVQELRWVAGRGERDVAILIDASMSMTLLVEGKTNFDRAVEEARTVVNACKPGDAVSIILAGPVPRPVIATPTANRQEIAAALDKLAPVGGTMAVLEALNAAGTSLAEGRNAAKKIVLITDGQNVGWDVQGGARWEFLAEGLKSLPSKPRIICRRLTLPKNYRNAAVADIAFSRKVVGSDRPVKIDVKVMNAGTAPIRPAAVELSVDGTPVGTEKMVTDIQPRASETVRFEHRFAQPGPRLVTARVICPDDLPADNLASRVVNVVDKLNVLIVDGAPSPRPLGGAGAFIELALTPRSSTPASPPEGSTPSGGYSQHAPDPTQPPEALKSPEGQKGTLPKGRNLREGKTRDLEDVQFLVEPKVIPAPELAAMKNLRDYQVIILANVARLPTSVANDLVAFVKGGGGLLIVPGDRVKPMVYNAWTTPASEPVLPARLADRRTVDQSPSRLEPRTFTHPALRILGDAKDSDATLALVKAYWRLAADEKDTNVRVGGRLQTGEPFLVDRKLGRGYVLMTAMAFEPSASNLITLKSFVPLMHELVQYLAAPMMIDANVAPGSEATIELHNRTHKGAAGSGLLGQYFGTKDFTNLVATRIDPTINFDWAQDARPHAAIHGERYSIRWTGWVQPLYSERYTVSVLGDDGIKLFVNDELIADGWKLQNPTEYQGTVDLTAGRRTRIKVDYFNNSGSGVAKLRWQSPSQPREIIPSRCLFPAAAPTPPKGAGEDKATPKGDLVEVITPSQRHCAARFGIADDILRISFTETQEPGLYTISLPRNLAPLYAPEGSDGTALPLVVLTKIEESCLDALTSADMNTAGKHVDLFETERSDEMASAVAGGVPGEELWKYLVIGALFALLAEIAITRWVAVQRRLHVTESVSFSAEIGELQTFRQRARELLAVPSKRSGM